MWTSEVPAAERREDERERERGKLEKERERGGKNGNPKRTWGPTAHTPGNACGASVRMI